MRFQSLSRFLALSAVVGIGAAGAATDTRVVEAMKNQDRATLQSLLKLKASVNTPEADGTTALLWAVRSNDVESVRLLIGAGANVKATNRYGIAPITEAATTGSAPVIDALLKAGADPNTAAGDGETTLMTAARSGSAAAVEMLLARGADVNAKEAWHGQTALMWAAIENHPDVIRALLKSGAAIAEKSKITVSGGRGRTTQSGGLTPLVFAARDGSLDAARALIEGGANVNEPAVDQTTPLVASILNAHYDVARYLLDHGADPNLVNSGGAGPLYNAVNMRNLEHSNRPAPPQLNREESLEMIKLLLARGANPNAQLTKEFPLRGLFEHTWMSLGGATPFMRAAKSSDVTVMRLLLEHGADPNIATGERTTPLMAAAGVGYEDLQTLGTEAESIEAMTICLEHGANVNAANGRGQTAMHGAAHRDSPVIIQFLADHGASLTVQDKTEKSPMDYAEGLRLSASGQGYHKAAIDKLKQLLAARGESTTAGGEKHSNE